MKRFLKISLFSLFLITGGLFLVDIDGAHASDPNQRVLDMLTSGKSRPHLDSGCAFRYLTVRQISLGNNSWSPPIFIPDPGYGKDGYMMVSQSSWYPSDRLSTAMKNSGIPIETLKEEACGRRSGQLIDGTDIFVRTGKTATWRMGKDTSTYPVTIYREMKVGCFAKAKNGRECK